MTLEFAPCASGRRHATPGVMRTAFIGAYGYGNLGDELCLIEAMGEFPPTEAFARRGFARPAAFVASASAGVRPAG